MNEKQRYKDIIDNHAGPTYDDQRAGPDGASRPGAFCLIRPPRLAWRQY